MVKVWSLDLSRYRKTDCCGQHLFPKCMFSVNWHQILEYVDVSDGEVAVKWTVIRRNSRLSRVIQKIPDPNTQSVYSICGSGCNG